MSKPARCDIFCTVVDNYGDIGVCWRLARQLAHEHGIAVRLWVDDLASFRRLCPEVDVQLAQQHCRGVEVRHWTALFPEVEAAQLVIEAFACELPERYVAAMAAQERKSVWINLEYLSAEDWVEGCHQLPSPHPSLPLVKYFFFPGFTPQTGGLLLERDLLARRDAFQQDPQALAEFWQAFGVRPSRPDETRISLFSYENPALPDLLRTWAQGRQPLTCLLPEGRALPQVAAFFGSARAAPGDVFKRGNLQVRVLPFVEQERYDELLWACDINFVRGEDSCVRAQWAAKPFVWHIYPQHDGVHMHKLRAFMALYCAGLPTDAVQALHALWEEWNGGPDAGAISAHGWNDFWMRRAMLRQHAHTWAQHLSGNSLALNLLDFFRKIDRMRGLQN
ncbi:hypothetical protein RHDC2_00870 [Rhodocyclaceae bacterium]|nr:hypothetical protein RHDC2_00870 [Rhodocyclaceae bacterium]